MQAAASFAETSLSILSRRDARWPVPPQRRTLRLTQQRRTLGSSPTKAAATVESVFALTHVLPESGVASILAHLPFADLSNTSMIADGIPAATGVTDVIRAVRDGEPVAIDAVELGPQRMEGILSPISDSIEAFTLGAQGLFKVNGVPYPLGSAIIFTTFTVKVLTFPFTKAQVESTLNIQNLQPQIEAIRERYQDDPERMNVEINRLYEERQVSPLAGCLPLLLTLPVVWGLYRAFNNASIDGSFDEPWFFIPSLAGPSESRDLSWLLPLDAEYNPPIGWHDAALYLIVPALTVMSQFLSTDLLKASQQDEKEKDQQSLLLNILPLFIGYVSLTVPAGLTLYWLFNNTFTTATQVYLRQGGGAKARVEKTDNVFLKVPLGCAYLDKSKFEAQPRDEDFLGPYVVYDDDRKFNSNKKFVDDGVSLAAAVADAQFYTSVEEREAEKKRWASLLEKRGKRTRSLMDREIASIDELDRLAQSYKAAGMNKEASLVHAEKSRLILLGGDDYIGRLKTSPQLLK